MPLRLVEMVCPEERRSGVDSLLEGYEPVAVWHDQLTDDQVLVNVLLPMEQTEDLLDDLQDEFGSEDGFRIVMLPVEATVPQVEHVEEDEEPEKARISRQELYDAISGQGKLTGTYMVMILLSSFVAAIGIWQGNVAVIIGAMVIAPMLYPNMAIALSNTLGDGDLFRRAMKTTFAGVGAALVLAVAAGFALPLGGEEQQALWGTRVGLHNIALALAAGGAGSVAVTRGERTSLVGVMVAVALLPPLVALGLALGSGAWASAVGAGLLFLTNFICINLAAIATFMLQGVRPRTWFDQDKARRSARRAVGLWVALLVLLTAAILFAQGHIEPIAPDGTGRSPESTPEGLWRCV